MKQKLIIIACVLVYLSLIFGLNNFPPALNADEAAFGYNAYSLFKTGKDEYGVFLPLRMQSFGDFKLPLYSYLSAPLVGIFGLNEFSTRLLAKIVGLGLILLIYQLSLEFFKNKKIALITLILSTVSPWIYIFSNQAHETGLATLLIGLSLLFLHRFWQKKRFTNWGLSMLFGSLSLYAYHSTKVIFPFLFLLQIYLFWQSRQQFQISKARSFLLPVVASGVVLLSFTFSEMLIPASRVKNLLLFSHENINLITSQANIEARFSPYGQKLFIDFREFLNRYYSYFSPEFLVSKGDVNNARFGFAGFNPLNYLDYAFFLIGLYFVLGLKDKQKFLILLPLIVTPLAGSLSWQEYSLSRTHAMIVSLLPLAGFGLYKIVKKQAFLGYCLVLASVLLSLTSIYFLQVHYPQRAHVIRSWQSGYKELVNYTQTNYDTTDSFYITKKHGQPYIFFLFYLNYPPEKYQPQARLSEPDEYGFGQVEQLDKYVFKFTSPKPGNKNHYVGYPDDFSDSDLSSLEFKDIVMGTETIFKITD